MDDKNGMNYQKAGVNYIALWNLMLKSFTRDFEDEPNSMPKSRAKYIVYFFLADLILFNLSIYMAASLKNWWFASYSQYPDFLLIANISFLIVGAFVKKYTPGLYINKKYGLWFLLRTTVGVLYLNAFIMVLFKVYYLSRIHFLFSFVLYQALLFAVYLAFYHLGGERLLKSLNGVKERWFEHGKLNYRFIILDFFLFLGSYYLIYYIRYNTFALQPEHERMLILLVGTGAIAGFSTRKFEILPYKNFFYKISPIFKSYLVMFALTGLSMFFLGWYELSHKLIFGSISMFFGLEIAGVFFLYITRKQMPADIEEVAEMEKSWRSEKAIAHFLSLEESDAVVRSVKERLQNQYLTAYPELFEFIAQNIDLQKVDEQKSVVLNTHTSFNLEVINDNSKQLLINLHKLNDFRRVNRYFLIVHRKLLPGGYFVGQAHTLKTHKDWMYEKFPTFIANLLYPLDFFFRRVCPKLPYIKNIYFLITRGQNRLISRAEVLGRLHFCGFKVIAEKEMNNRLYYIARKIRFPSIDRNPSYGPLIKLRRIGLDGRLIYVYKFRTMHPYSEYLQDYVYEKNKLEQNGKFANDFRITTWGKWMRRLWIDELPQLYNFLRGDLSLIGVRALSPHYFSLYPDDVKEMRIKFKPGLVPPYYADMPNSFEEIVESERRYLLKKMQSPFLTDCQYFTKAMFNILFRNARSR
ncbi:sugar transferase [Caldithrix abyssi DSM 13497]|uniref:Sugar transferase n=2 Tax=Caldithrix abyssi DSM 13497 TaxID=880073 RepID=H1XRN9_CALAY|nr:sugar transferase [Caldithrix abyssi DSM 13497]